MPIFRQKRPKRHRDPYPRQGTPEGEAIIGPCDGPGCERTLKRFDMFWTLLSGQTVCLDCYEKSGVDPTFLTPPSYKPPSPEPLIFDGELPF